MPTPGVCVSIMSELPADGEVKLCGPGKWSISRMSCDKHGYIGSAIFTCDATAR